MAMLEDVFEVPCSFAQGRLWFLDCLEPGSAASNVPTLVRLAGRLDVAALARSLQCVVDRHEALRTVFADRDGEPVQRVRERMELELPLVDLSGPAGHDSEARALAEREARRPFDLACDPLLRALLLRLGPEEHRLVLVIHHIVADAWSMEILVREAAAFYRGFVAGAPVDLPEPPIQYADFAVWQRERLEGELRETLVEAWRRRLDGAPPTLELPFDGPRRGGLSGGGQVEMAASPALAAAVRSVSRASRTRGATPYMVLTAAFAAFLGRHTGQEDLVLGSFHASRDRPETQGLIGFFVNPLPLRIDLSGDPSFEELVRRAREVLLDAYAHQEIPFEVLVEELVRDRDTGRSPLFQVILNLAGGPAMELELPGLSLRAEALDNGAARFELSLDLREEPAGLAGRWSYDRALFDRSTVARMRERFAVLLEAAATEPGRRLSEIPLLPASESHQLVREWNPLLSYPDERCLHELFEAQAARRPHAVALTTPGEEDEELTYGELDARAERLACDLRRRGVGPETIVGLVTERTAATIVGLLAILKAGGAWLPIDPDYPRERIDYLLADSGVSIVLREESAGDGEEGGARAARPVADNLAYVIYTSGSTGKPKGTPITHRNVVRFLASLAPHADFREDDVWALFHSLSFDLSVWEIWGALASGARLVVVPTEVKRSPRDFHALLCEQRVTSIIQTPSAFRLLARADDEATAEERSRLALRRVVFCGEALDPASLASWFGHHGDERPVLINAYGPTEATVFLTWRRMTVADLALAGRSPMGWAVGDATTYVVDGWERLAPIGVRGELRLGGAALARGYLGRPALTAERFVPDPFADTPGSRLYRTGDLVRASAIGDLESLGRNDDQVKVRGFRIELGEVTAALAAHPAVAEAVVLAREERLIAWLVPRPGAALAVAELRAFAGDRLPAHMVPSAWVVLPRLPLNTHGKVDRRALPDPEERPNLGKGGEEGVAPRTSAEAEIAGIWSSLLGIEGIGVHDDFFAVGGHSLLALRLLSRLGSEVPLAAFLEEPTVAGLARRITRIEETALPPLTAVPRGPAPPLSFAQERMWYLDRLDPGTPAQVLATALRLTGSLRPERLAAALANLVRRHEALRTTFRADAGAPFQVIAPSREQALPEVDLADLPPAVRDAELRRLAAEEPRRRLDLEAGPLLRTTLVRIAPTEHVLFFLVHHIVADGWSMAVVVREVIAAYTALLDGSAPELPPLPVHPADVAVWQRARLTEETIERELSWWREHLAGEPPDLALPFDRPRGPRPEGPSGSVVRVLPPAVAAGVRRLARRGGVTPFMALLAVFAALLARVSGEEDLWLGAPMADRERAETDGLVGLFLDTLVLRLGVHGDPRASELLRRSRGSALASFAHRGLPFEHLVRELAAGRPGRRGLFQVLIALQNLPAEPLVAPGLAVEPLRTGSGSTFFDLGLWLRETPGELAAVWEYRRDLFDEPTVIRLADTFERLLAALAEGDPRLSDLPLLSAAERHQLVREWNPLLSYPDERCLHELFEARAARRPEAIALTTPGAAEEELTYGELDARAERLARALRRRGVGPETIVGLVTERTAATIVGLLAILKAGGAWLPIDPDYPRERIDYLLADSGVSIVLREESAGDGEEEGARSVRPVADNLAYVIYTSGSTGKPKGTPITHRNVVRFLASLAPLADFREDDVWALFHSLSFDLSVWEIWGALASGARLVVVPTEVKRSPRDFHALLCEQRVTSIIQTPSAFRLLARADDEATAEERSRLALRRVVLCGEALDPASLASWFSHHGDERPLLINAYGPTEATVFLTWRRMTAADLALAGRSPMGWAVGDATTYGVDGWERLAPIGVRGELRLGGAALARGYLGRPALTAERFVPDPFAETPGSRLYRTGDLVRALPAGDLEYLGRNDDQVKVRGFRIELGEVTAALASHPAVSEAVVLARDQRLIAWLVPRPGADLAVAELRAFAGDRLPAHMVPSAWVVLPRLPLNTHGKVDRRALPDPKERPDFGEGGEGGEEGVAPRTPAEAEIAAVWSSLLGIEGIGVHDDFFAVGGHSLLAVQMLARLPSEVPLAAFLEEPTVAGLARRITQLGETALPPLAAVPRGQALPLSFAQEGMWYLDRLAPGSPTQILSSALRLTGPLRPERLAAALGFLARRHESLRTTFRAEDGSPVQEIAPEPAEPALAEIDLSALPAALREPRLRRLLQEEARRPFDLEAGPLLRATLVRLAPEEHALFFLLHHIAGDAWSMAVLVREAIAAYAALAAGVEPDLPPLPVQPADLAVRQRERLTGERVERELAWWREQLAGGPPDLPLPFDRPRGPRPESRSGAVARTLPAVTAAGVRRLARRAGVTPFMALLAAFAALLARVSGEDDLWLGSPMADRGRPELENVVGLLLDMLVLRLGVEGDPRVSELLRRTRASALGAFAHRDLPYELLVRDLASSLNGDRMLYRVLIALQDVPAAPLVAPGLTVERLDSAAGATYFDLTLYLREAPPEDLSVLWEYRRDLFDEPTVIRLADAFERLLAAACEDTDQRLSELPLLSAAERHQVLREWNDSAVAMPVGSLPARLADRPGAVALVMGEEAWTYQELLDRAAALAAELGRRGVRRGDVVGLYGDRSPALWAGALGVLQAGAAWLPHDPAYPRERLRFALEDAEVTAVLADAHRAGEVEAPAVIPLDGSFAPAPVKIDSSPQELAYVIYTSGSTGRPKGAMVEHAGLLNHLQAKVAILGLTCEDVVAQSSSQSFDVSVWQVFAPLLAGARVEVLPDPVAHDPAALLRAVTERGITVLEVVPSLLAALLEEPFRPLPSLRWMIATGEALPAELARRWFAIYPDIPLLNAYGPTECSDDVSHEVLRSAPARDAARVAIGRTVDNLRLHVLDRHLEPLPMGCSGELWVGGAGVGRGYLGDPRRTAESFRPDPFSPEPGRRLYGTGDLVRARPDGRIEFLGRADDQVKVRGFRIEPGEVTAALAAHPGVAEAVVLARGDRLVAWLVPRQDSAPPTVAELRAFAAERLPAPMVPSAWVMLPELPRTPNGKVDRRALPEPAERSESESATAVPRTPVEAEVAALFAALLERREVGAGDEFFALGGHSLLAVQLLSRVRQRLGVEIPLAELFEEPTVAGLARRIEERRRGAAGLLHEPPLVPLPAGSRRRGLPLSFAQESMWYLAQLDPGSAVFNIASAVRLRGPLRPDRFAAALGVLVDRHEALRTIFHVEEGSPVQRVAPAPGQPYALPEIDLSALPAEIRETELLRLAREEARRPFDLERGPLLRAGFVRSEGEEGALLFAMHHIASDAWSMAVLVREATRAYAALAAGEDPALPALPALPVQPADVAVWQRAALSGEALERALAWWRERLAGGPPELALPYDRPRGSRPDHRGGAVFRRLPAELSAAVRRLAGEAGGTPFVVLLAVFAALLARTSGVEDLWLGSPIAGRDRPELEGLIGLFVNTLLLRLDLHGDPAFGELLGRVRAAVLGAYDHRLPYERLVREVGRRSSDPDLFRVLFALQNVPAVPLELAGLKIAPLAAERDATPFDLALVLDDREEGIAAVWEYRRDRFDGATVARLADDFERLLGQAAEGGAERRLSEFGPLSTAERSQVRGGGGDGGGGDSRGRRMRILLTMNVPWYPSRGGADKGNRLLIEELAAHGHEVEAVVPALATPPRFTAAQVRERLESQGIAVAEEGGAHRYLYNGVRVHAVLDPSSLRSVLRERLRAFAPDRVVVSSEDPSHNLLETALAEGEERVVALIQTPAFLPFGPHSFFPSPSRAELLRRAALVIAGSEFSASYARRHGGLNATGIYWPAYGEPPFPRLGRYDGEFVTLINPCALKGLPIFLDLARAMPEVRFAAVPTWGTTSADRAVLATLPNVTLLEPQEDFDRILERTRVLLVPSLIVEGFGMTVIEGMVRGIPVIASALGGLVESKQGTRYSIPVRAIERFTDRLDENLIPIPVVPPQDAEPWRLALSELLADRETYEREAEIEREVALRYVESLSAEPLERLLEAMPDRDELAGAKAVVSGRRPAAPAAGTAARLADLSPEQLALLMVRLRRRSHREQAVPPLVAGPRPERLPLSFAQQRVWLAEKLAPGTPAYNIPLAVEVEGELDGAAFARALDEVVRRHESLRTVFGERGGEPFQIVLPPPTGVLQRLDLTDLDPARRSEEARRLAAEEAARPFDLAAGPVLRARLLDLAADRHVFLLTVHHIAADGWSLRRIFEETAALYLGEPLPPPPLQYADFALWQRGWLTGATLEREIDGWRRRLAGIEPVSPLPFLPAAAPGGAAATERALIPVAVVERLDALGRAERATLFMTLVAALAVLVRRASGQDDVVLGTHVANRNRRELEGVVGFFVNNLVLRVDLAGEPTFREALGRVRRTVLDAQAHQDLPYEKLVEAVAPGERGRSRLPLIPLMVAFEDPSTEPPPSLPGLALHPFAVPDGAAKLDLTLFVNPRPEGLLCAFEYDAGLFDAAAVAGLAADLRDLLAEAAERPDEPIDALGLATPPPGALDGFNDDLDDLEIVG